MTSDIFGPSLAFYQNSGTASAYAVMSSLYPSEALILDTLRPLLATMDMLDLGVGAGRTTPHFAPFVRGYTGCDFSAAMIGECRRKFPQNEFVTGDASNLDIFPDNSFDFILFSFNGLDCMNENLRAAALREMQRLLRPGGTLAFSSHNLQSVPHARSTRHNMALLRPSVLIGTMRSTARFLRRTRSVVFAPDRQSALVTEMHLGHRVPIFFIRPAKQVEALKAMGWEAVKIIPCDSQMEIISPADIETAVAPWIYYLCQKPSK